MDQRVRLIAATAVMLLGLGLALCFRRAPGETPLTIPAEVSSASAGVSTAPQSVAVTPAPKRLPIVPLSPPKTPTTIVTPGDQPAPPPEFPKRFPSVNETASTRWGTSMADVLPERASSPPTHKIVDGDTLPLLAERYLGSKSRAMEIYEANRNLLTEGPNVLPNGWVLKIPRNDQAAGREQGARSEEPGAGRNDQRAMSGS